MRVQKGRGHWGISPWLKRLHNKVERKRVKRALQKGEDADYELLPQSEMSNRYW